MSSVGIVIPAYRPPVDRLDAYVTALDERLDPDVIRIELDGADETTVAKLAELPVEINAVDARRGKGAAITAGFEALETDVLAFADADGSTPADSMAAVLAPLLDEEADVSVGSRRHPDATVTSHQTIARRALGDGFALLARLLLGSRLHDFQCGAKALTRSTWERVRSHLYESGFAWDVELIAMATALDCRIVEVPVTWTDQPGSTVSTIDTTLDLGRALVTARHRAKLLAGNRFHRAIAARRSRPTALIDRHAMVEEE